MLPPYARLAKKKDKEGNEKKDPVNFDLIIACKTAVIMLIPKNAVTTPASPSLLLTFCHERLEKLEVTRSV